VFRKLGARLQVTTRETERTALLAQRSAVLWFGRVACARRRGHCFRIQAASRLASAWLTSGRSD
jgi:hypothetical protein